LARSGVQADDRMKPIMVWIRLDGHRDATQRKTPAVDALFRPPTR
jgi:hypothetical protein